MTTVFKVLEKKAYWFACFYFQVSSSLLNRVSTAEKCFNKEMELEPRVSADFELTLDDHSVLRAVQMLNFFQMKGKR